MPQLLHFLIRLLWFLCLIGTIGGIFIYSRSRPQTLELIERLTTIREENARYIVTVHQPPISEPKIYPHAQIIENGPGEIILRRTGTSDLVLSKTDHQVRFVLERTQNPRFEQAKNQLTYLRTKDVISVIFLGFAVMFCGGLTIGVFLLPEPEQDHWTGPEEDL